MRPGECDHAARDVRVVLQRGGSDRRLDRSAGVGAVGPGAHKPRTVPERFGQKARDVARRRLEPRAAVAQRRAHQGRERKSVPSGQALPVARQLAPAPHREQLPPRRIEPRRDLLHRYTGGASHLLAGLRRLHRQVAVLDRVGSVEPPRGPRDHPLPAVERGADVFGVEQVVSALHAVGIDRGQTRAEPLLPANASSRSMNSTVSVATVSKAGSPSTSAASK